MEGSTTQPLVTVIMPAFNAAHTIKESIASVVAQSYTRWEFIIINDSAADDTAEIIHQAAENEPRIRLLTNPANIGVAATRNRGIHGAKGAYIAFLDSDDLWHPEKLAKQIDFMQINDAAISYTATAFIYNGKSSAYVLHAEGRLTPKDLLKRNIMSCSSVMVKREVMLRHLFPVRKEIIHEDLAAWLCILNEVGVAHGLDEPLLCYRMAGNTKSSGRFRSMVMTVNAYRCVGYSLPVSCLMALRYAKHSLFKRYMINAGST